MLLLSGVPVALVAAADRDSEPALPCQVVDEPAEQLNHRYLRTLAKPQGGGAALAVQQPKHGGVGLNHYVVVRVVGNIDQAQQATDCSAMRCRVDVGVRRRLHCAPSDPTVELLIVSSIGPSV